MPVRFAAVALALLVASPAAAQWTRVGGIPATEVGAVFAHGGTLYVGALDGIYVSRDDGATWTRTPLAADLDNVWAFAATPDGRIFAGSYGGILESPDGGTTWMRRDDGLAGDPSVADFAVHDGRLYVATLGNGVYRLDLATPNATWAPFSSGLPYNVDAIHASGDRLVAGGSANGYIFLCGPGVPCWSERVFVPFDESGPRMTDFVDTPAGLLGGGSHGVFRSTDRGQTWTRTDLGLGSLERIRFAVAGARLYAITNHNVRGTSVAVSDDEGVSWSVVETVRGARTYDAVVQGDRLYAARLDGLWQRTLLPTDVAAPDAAPRGVRLHPIAPTAVRDIARVTFDLDAATDVDLAVYDLIGRRVATLAGGPHAPGRHTATWEPGALASGAYRIRLVAGGHRQTLPVQRVR